MRTRVRLPPPPPGFDRSAAEGEACPGIVLLSSAKKDDAGLPYRAANCARASHMKGYTYVYVLQSKHDPSRHYTGLTDDLAKRLKKHNEGGVPHTAKYKPWGIRTATAFHDRERAAPDPLIPRSWPPADC